LNRYLRTYQSEQRELLLIVNHGQREMDSVRFISYAILIALKKVLLPNVPEWPDAEIP